MLQVAQVSDTAVADGVPPAELRRVLVVKPGHHGDVLLATPAIAELKRVAPAAEIDALVYDDTVPMLEGHPALSRIHAIGRAWRALGVLERLARELDLFGELRRRHYDLLVHLSEQNRGAWLARTLGVRWSVAPNRAGRFWNRSFTHRYPKIRNGRRHQVELNLDALRRIGIDPAPGRRVVFVPGDDANLDVARAMVEHGLEERAFVHLHPASRWRFKCWTVEGNAALIDRLADTGLRVVVTSSPDPAERLFVEAILERTTSKPLDLGGRLSIKALGALAGRARVFIGVDSMPMHLAAAMGTPTVALFGPSGDLEWGPWAVEHRIVASEHSCRPCGLDGCGGGKKSECLSTLPVGAVERAVRNVLGATR